MGCEGTSLTWVVWGTQHLPLNSFYSESGRRAKTSKKEETSWVKHTQAPSGILSNPLLWFIPHVDYGGGLIFEISGAHSHSCAIEAQETTRMTTCVYTTNYMSFCWRHNAIMHQFRWSLRWPSWAIPSSLLPSSHIDHSRRYRRSEIKDQKSFSGPKLSARLSGSIRSCRCHLCHAATRSQVSRRLATREMLLAKCGP